MTTKYNIGTLNETTLATGNPNLGFTVVNNGNPTTIETCINSIKSAEANSEIKSKYVAISKDSTGTGLGITGKCYKGISYNPIINPDDTTGILFDIYESWVNRLANIIKQTNPDIEKFYSDYLQYLMGLTKFTEKYGSGNVGLEKFVQIKMIDFIKTFNQDINVSQPFAKKYVP